ncbi:YgjV family protein [Aliivibrio sp. EL58]|uniref:YgjV family protein n=1 Tax=Aliivibrio sp. EL58 TaxID=2107582 RepID=UPI000EFA462C|nr:YgjV family protein [Aliivibrio sp. EL58]
MSLNLVDVFSFAQLLGFLSFVLGIAAFYQKNDKRLKLLMLALNINHMIHYLLLGSTVSALSSLLSAMRTTTAIFIRNGYIAFVFVCTSLLFGILTTDYMWQLFPLIGTAIGSYAIFMLDGIRMRCWFFIGAACWLINNILIGSIGGVLLEITAMSVNIITIIRLHKDSRILENNLEIK